MNICFIAHANNYHIEKWCRWFVSQGHEVHLVSFVNGTIDNVMVHWIDAAVGTNDSNFKKSRYLLHGREIRRTIDEIRPDVINVHYASSYGTAVALSGIKNYVLSVWGNDVYEFPRRSKVHEWMLRYSLSRATVLFSTSKAMAEECRKYTKKKFSITPFGVDMDLFSPNKRDRGKENTDFVIGTIKALRPKYGIDYLLKAVAILRKTRPEMPLKLRIAGKGESEEHLKKLAWDLHISDITTWLGFISQQQAAREWANMDIGIVASADESESFGVSVVEAQACGTPVIVSDIPGLMEATSPGQSSLVVPRKDERALADAIVKLYENINERIRMGECGRAYASRNYEMNHCFSKIEALLTGGYLERRSSSVFAPPAIPNWGGYAFERIVGTVCAL